MPHFYCTGDPITYPLLRENARRMRKNPTKAEMALWQYLRDNQLGVKFFRQHIIGEYIVDFACLAKRLIIEVDGAYHFREDQMEEDAIREHFLTESGFRILRFTNEEVTCNTTQTVNKIREMLK